MTATVDTVAAAISLLIDAHGVPNRFSVGEIAATGRDQMATGRVLARPLAEVERAVGGVCLRLVQAGGRRFVVVEPHVTG